MDGNAKFICQPSLVVLFGIPSSTWLCPRLVDAAMGAINRDDEGLSVVGIVDVPIVLVVLLLLLPKPLNLTAAGKQKTIR
jgi:hypothetical protein